MTGAGGASVRGGAATARGGDLEAEAELNADRLLPQHIVISLHGLLLVRSGGGAAKPLQQARPSRQRQPAYKPDYRVRETNNANGAATQMLMQLKQSIRLPMKPVAQARRNRKMMSAGPSSFASRWVTRQVARTARTKARSGDAVELHRLDPLVPANAESHQILPGTTVVKCRP